MGKSIVVVDDEKLVIYGICSLLSENSTCYEIAATCRNGDEGLRSCLENHPDLLLTDIGMPGMDGLQLIERVRQTNPEMKIVVLSCHDEYDLVHRAFMMGADDYILKKDIDKKSLYRILNRLFPKDSKDKSIHAKSDIIPPLSDINDFTPLKPGSIGIIGFKSENQSENTEILWQPDIPMLHQLIKDDILLHGKYFLGLRNDLVIFFPDLNIREKGKIDNLLEKTRQSVSKYINRQVFIARYIMKSSENIIEAYNKGLKILDGLFYCKSSSILTESTSLPAWRSSLTFTMTSSSFEQGWFETLDNFLNTAEKEWVNPEAIKAELAFAVKHLLFHLEEDIKVDLSSSLNNVKITYYQRIAHFNDIVQLKNWVKKLLHRIAEKLNSGRHGSNAVFSTKLYIGEHLHEDLRLSVVADIIGINSNHLSTVFKKEAGQSYIEYLNRKRVEHACELLETTDYSAKEIAYRCGYLNPNYFSRIFKKLMNSTISEYRSRRKQ